MGKPHATGGILFYVVLCVRDEDTQSEWFPQRPYIIETMHSYTLPM